MAGCAPGVSRVLPQYFGDFNTTYPYYELKSFKTWLRACDRLSCTYYTTAKIIVHNPLRTKFISKLTCEYYLGDYRHSVIKSKWFTLPKESSVEMTPFTNLIDVLNFVSGENIELRCSLRNLREEHPL